MDGDRSYVQKKETYRKTRTNYEQGQYFMHAWVPVKEGDAAKETEKALKGSRFGMLARRVKFVRISPGGRRGRTSG